MRLSRSTISRAAWRSPAFTLIELLIVIALIAVLISLTAAAATRVILAQQKKNTQATVNKVNGMFEQQYKAAVDDARDYLKSHPMPGGVTTMANGDAERAKVIWIKLWLKNEFPTTFTEASTGITPGVNNTYGISLPTPQSYKTALAGIALTAVPKESESSACLFLALSRSRRGVQSQLDTMTAREVLDTDNDGLKEFVDAWGKPLKFFRWPTGNPGTDDANPQPGLLDPEDPTKRLQDPGWVGTAGATAFRSLCHVLPVTHYLHPVLVSDGPDRTLGYQLDAQMTMTVQTQAATYDDILSYNK